MSVFEQLSEQIKTGGPKKVHYNEGRYVDANGELTAIEIRGDWIDFRLKLNGHEEFSFGSDRSCCHIVNRNGCLCFSNPYTGTLTLLPEKNNE